MRAALAALLLAGCVTAPKPVPVEPIVAPPEAVVVASNPQAPMRALVQAFVAAVEARRFDEVLPLLARPIRDRYSVESLQRDFGADPLASARLAGIKRVLDAQLDFSKSIHDAEGKGGSRRTASVEWAPGRALRLIFEADADTWRIAALE